MEFAKLLGQTGEAETPALEALCRAAETELTGKLRDGVAPEDCGGAFPVAAAWLALAGLCAGQGGEPASWSAGAVSVSGGMTAKERIRTLQEQAMGLMAPYVKDEGFAFRGVRG